MFELAKFVGIIGDTKEVLIFLVILATIFFFYNKNKDALITISAFAIASAITFALKNLFKIPRPINMLIQEDGYRFPSGHATAAGVVFVLSIFFAQKYFPHKKQKNTRIIIYVLAFGWTVLSMYSRVYLHVHFWIDVFMGAFIGVGITTLVVHIFTKHLFYKRGKDLI